ncbi:MAG: 50S ribosomal protein L6 [Nanoarchaeota archaeon]|nr:50S ribosomal protein L6 [Nanoarchaeota archaeon]MCG2718474.1 50S ribosomal protein L6 [Nanoarchaeota archaeon]
MLPPIIEKIEIPEGVTVEIADSAIKAKGPKGENEKLCKHYKIDIKKDDKNIILESKKPSKREKTMLYSFKAHLKNLLDGVNTGFTYKVKVCSSHFPMSVSVENNEVVIKNFLGEKIPRRSRIMPGVEVKIEGEILVVEGIDKEQTSITAAKIEQATRITNRDRRVFQDGCFIIEKAGKAI